MLWRSLLASRLKEGRLTKLTLEAWAAALVFEWLSGRRPRLWPGNRAGPAVGITPGNEPGSEPSTGSDAASSTLSV